MIVQLSAVGLDYTCHLVAEVVDETSKAASKSSAVSGLWGGDQVQREIPAPHGPGCLVGLLMCVWHRSHIWQCVCASRNPWIDDAAAHLIQLPFEMQFQGAWGARAKPPSSSPPSMDPMSRRTPLSSHGTLHGTRSSASTSTCCTSRGSCRSCWRAR